MATRSIKLKLIVPRGSADQLLRQSLWTTHRVVNEATAYYEQALLAMRQLLYETGDGEIVSASQVTKRLEAMVAAARDRNGKPGGLTDQIATDLRALYEAIVPSSVRKKGKAENARGYLGPLVDPNSTGFQNIFDVVANVPDWVEGVRNGEAEAFEAAEDWAAGEEGQARQRLMGGAPPTWVRLWRKHDRNWVQAFIDDLDRKTEEAKGVPSIIRRLKEAGVLPLFEPAIASRIRGGEGLTWDRLAFGLAVGHLLSWESWCHRASDEHAKRRERVESFRRRYFTQEVQVLAERLRRYEAERHEELERSGLAPVRPFRITRRMLRNWPELRRRWLSREAPTMDELLEMLRGEQTRLRGRFGDPHLLQWLAREENHALWRHPADVVGLVGRLNAMQAVLDRSRGNARMTLPDPREHPKSVQWDHEKGTNLRKYRLRVTDGGNLEVELPLLSREGDALVERNVTLALAPSGQFQDVRIKVEGKKVQVSYRSSTGETLTGTLGWADLMFDWPYVRNRPAECVEAGDIGPVYLKLAADQTPMLPEGWTPDRPDLYHFQSALGGKDKHVQHVKPGLRVLSVDLGVRSFAACSVFELREARDDDKLAFEVPVGERGLWAVHERSFMLRMPGERPGSRGERWRRQAEEELRSLRRAVGRYRRLYRLAAVEASGARENELEELTNILSEGQGWPFERSILDRLRAVVDQPQAVWEEAVAVARRQLRAELGKVIRDWRRRTRTRDPHKAVGKCMWGIQYLTDVRRLLKSWSFLGAASGEIRRQDRKRRGVFAGRLLEHLGALKEDYLKTGADLIVQAARGYLRDEQGRWKQAFAPAQVILFEDLSRYRTRTDRPRRENSLLMKWSHRSVVAEVSMQGQLYGMHVVDTAAGFSSRYHAGTHTPGIRAHALRDGDLEDGYILDWIQRENPNLKLNGLGPGDLVPLSGGEWFLSLAQDGKTLTRIHADINAAQNLQRRFWTRHAEAFRLVCSRIEIDGQTRWLPCSMGKRLLGALGGHGYLVPTGHESGSCRWEQLSQARWRRLCRESQTAEEEDSGPDTELEELAGLVEEHLEYTEEVVVFFRDPSGVVYPKDLWYPSQEFWMTVKNKTVAALRLDRT